MFNSAGGTTHSVNQTEHIATAQLVWQVLCLWISASDIWVSLSSRSVIQMWRHHFCWIPHKTRGSTLLDPSQDKREYSVGSLTRQEGTLCWIPHRTGGNTLLDLLRSSDRVQWFRLALSKGPNRVGVSLPSPEDGNRSSLRNVVFSSI
jgi:hypothetical protein